MSELGEGKKMAISMTNTRGINLNWSWKKAFGIGLYCLGVGRVKVLNPSCLSVPVSSSVETHKPTAGTVPEEKGGTRNARAADWKKLNPKQLGISPSMIDKPTKFVLKTLRNKGYQVYLVGGCVSLSSQSMALNCQTKVVRTFPRCEIVGKRFPICHVHVSDYVIEVSSFSTIAKKSRRNFDNLYERPRGCDEDDYIRWRNCVQRDFTINGLMFDPYSKIVYDYIGGIEDLKNSRVRTISPAFSSFTEDCARILRAFRIAARLEFKFTKELALSLKQLSCSVLRLDKGRILMEINYMFAYGSAEASLRLLWKYGLLEILLPLQGAYFVTQGFRRRDKRSNLLLSLFSNLDKLLAPDRPCHSSLWVSLLAFHKALADHPQDPLVIAAFCLAIHNGGCLSEAISIAKSITLPYESSFPELLESKGQIKDEDLVNDVKDVAAAVKSALSQMTDETTVSQAMAKYPQAPFSDLVFISLALQLRTDRIVSCVMKGREKGFVPKHGTKIDYESLAAGNLHEVRYMLSRIIFDTIYPSYLNK